MESKPDGGRLRKRIQEGIMNEHEREHEHDFEFISADRLCEAAEAILHVMATMGDPDLNASFEPVELLGSAAQPACLSDFTREEVVEAAAFLHRLGVLSDD
jgi:hypothetical protein